MRGGGHVVEETASCKVIIVGKYRVQEFQEARHINSFQDGPANSSCRWMPARKGLEGRNDGSSCPFAMSAMSKGRNFRCRHDQIPLPGHSSSLCDISSRTVGLVVVAPATRNCHNVRFLLETRPPPIDICLDWPELVPVPSGGEIYGDWDYISEGLYATLFPPKSLQSVLVCLPRCRKALTGAVCHIAFYQLSLVADFIYLQDPSPATFRQISMAITRQARLNSIRYREKREYRHLPDARLDWDELPAST